MLPLLQLFLPEVAAHHRVAVLFNAIDEVLASHADHAPYALLQVALDNEPQSSIALSTKTCLSKDWSS